MRGIGKTCHVVVDEKIPDNIAFLNQSVIAAPDRLSPPSLSVLIDVGETERIGARAALFDQGDATMCIDHHKSSMPIYDYNYIDTAAAATAEIVYELLKQMEIPIGKDAAEALYTGIVTDTGRFQFGNTSASALRAAADLIERGVVPSRVATEVYQSVRVEKLHLENAVLGTMEMVGDGKGAVAYMTRQMLLEAGAMDEETEGVAEKLRGIRGVEISVFLRETEDGHTKASMRSRSWYDVSALASRFGGGGHIRAAGFTSDLPIFELLDKIKSILGKSL
jgi:phosphoesterase RecJ-like protein